MLSLGLEGRCATPISASKSTRPAVCKVSCLTQHKSSHFRLVHNARPRSVCRAEERSRESLKLSDKEKLVVPDTPPSKEASRTSEGASTSQPPPQTVEISEELRMLQERKRARSQETASIGWFASILQEVRLIEWPKPKAAVLNTVLVIFMVFATSGLLFGINTGLSELGKITYTR